MDMKQHALAALSSRKTDGKGLRVAIVHAQWNAEVVHALVAAAQTELLRAGAFLLEHLAQVGRVALQLALSGRGLLLRALKACTEERNCLLTSTGAQFVTIGARQRST